MYCTYCGKQASDNAKFCSVCGKPVRIQQEADELSGLVSKAREGDQDAVAALYEKTYSKVFYTVKAMIKDDDTVFDILQDSYIKAFSHLDRFEGNTKFLPWVRQIAANTARDFLKKKRPMLFAELSADEEQDTPPEEYFVDERSAYIPEQVIDQQETTRLIREIIDGLPEDQCAVIGMFYYEELSVKEIAAAMGVSESAVKSRLMYGRKKIEGKVRELEKRGTKLYGLAPIPFLLLLFRSQKAYAAGLLPNRQILQTVLERTVKPSADAAGSRAANAASKAAAEYTAGAAGAGGLGAAKIVLIVLASVAVIGGGVFGGVKFLSTRSTATLPGKGQTEQAIGTETETTSQTEELAKPTEDLIKSSEEQVKPTEEPSGPSSEETSGLAGEPVKESEPLAAALEQYRIIIRQADTYKYNPYADTKPSGSYRYALVQMQRDDLVPTLLLEQEATAGLYYALIFRYDPDSATVQEPSGILVEGGAQTGGYRGTLGMMKYGNGINITEFSSGTGSMTISRATLDGDSIQKVVEYEGQITDEVSEELSSIAIEWHNIEDASILDNWEVNTKTQAPDSGGAAGTGTSGTEMDLPADGGRIVFTGTINTYSYDEIVALQGQPDPNAQWANKDQTFRLIILDMPQSMALMGGESLRSSDVLLIDVSYAEGLEQYDGQHLIFSVDPYKTYWPGDTSLPLGQPRTKDIHILN